MTLWVQQQLVQLASSNSRCRHIKHKNTSQQLQAMRGIQQRYWPIQQLRCQPERSSISTAYTHVNCASHLFKQRSRLSRSVHHDPLWLLFPDRTTLVQRLGLILISIGHICKICFLYASIRGKYEMPNSFSIDVYSVFLLICTDIQGPHLA